MAAMDFIRDLNWLVKLYCLIFRTASEPEYELTRHQSASFLLHPEATAAYLSENEQMPIFSRRIVDPHGSRVYADSHERWIW